MTITMRWVNQPPEVEAAWAELEAFPPDVDIQAHLDAIGRINDVEDEHGCVLDRSWPGWAMWEIPRMVELGMVYGPSSARDIPGLLGDPTDWDTHVLAIGPHPERGVPLYKLSSNDDYLIHPVEITAALRILEESGDQRREDWWNRWLRFLYCARGWGGIKVT